ncbi:MAG TPA: MTH1187 family thiamine-binding protein [Clostridia bacterium]|nr:MTH1187 family thiamine-binding protein [Clostridia bacterium]
MNVIVDLCIVPIGVGVSLSPYVAACEKVLTEAGLKTVMHANGTNIEGEWDSVFAAIKQCHQVVHDLGSPRVFTTIRLGTRTDKSQTMDDKIKSVEAKLAGR